MLLADHLAANGVQLAADPAAVIRSSSAVATLDPGGAASYAFDLDWRLNAVRLPDGVAPVVVHTCSIAAVLAPGCEDVFTEVSLLRGSATVSYDVNLRPSISGTGPEVVEITPGTLSKSASTHQKHPPAKIALAVLSCADARPADASVNAVPMPATNWGCRNTSRPGRYRQRPRRRPPSPSVRLSRSS